MPYSQMYQHYQDPSYDGQQQPWDEVDFTNLQPTIGDYKVVREPGYYDMNAMNTDNQNVSSPNFSQFLNFDSSDVGSFSVPSEDVSSEPYYRTSPTSLDLSRQSTTYPLKLEPGLVQNESYPCGGMDGLSAECLPQGCRPESNCVQMTSLAEIEECNAPPCLSTSATSSIDHNNVRRSPPRRTSSDTKPITTVKEEREKKPRNKRGHKNSGSEDETAHIRAKQAHSVVERRYRDNLNGKIMQLHRALSATETTSRITGMPTQDFYASREHRGKVRKSDVMTDAMNYVHQSEVEIRHMTDEITRLNDRVKALEKLVKCEDCTLLKQMVRLQLQQQGTQ